MKAPIIKRIITHVDGKTKLTVKGKIENGYFVAEYRFEGMTWGFSEQIEQ